jgi:hypothetical protein
LGGLGFDSANLGGEGLRAPNYYNLADMGGGQGLTAGVEGGTLGSQGLAPSGYAASTLGATGGTSTSFGDFLKQGQNALRTGQQLIGEGQQQQAIRPTTGAAGEGGQDQAVISAVDAAIGQGPGGFRQTRFFGALTPDVDRALAYQDEYYARGGDEVYGGEDIEQEPQGIAPVTLAYADGGQIMPFEKVYANGGQPGLAPNAIPAANPSSQFTPMQRQPQGDQVQMLRMRLDEMKRMNPAMVGAMVNQAQQAGMTPVMAQQVWMLATAALQNPQVYPQIRQYAIQGLKISPNTLPEQFDPGRLSTLAGIAHMVSNGTAPTVAAPMTGYSSGGRISGPGSGTSDSIEAEVNETGEEIRVSNGEYIVPADVVETLGTRYFDNLVKRHHKFKSGYQARE